MKVLHIIWNARFGGIEKLVYDLCIAQNTLSSIQADVFIAKEEGEFLDKFKTSNLQLHFSKLKKGFDLNLNEYLKIRRLFENYEVIHFHIYNPLLCLFAMSLKNKIVFTEHGNFGFGRKKRKIDCLVSFTKEYFLKYVTAWITYNSYFTKRIAEGFYNIQHIKHASVVYNGTARFNSETHSWSSNINEVQRRLKDKIVIGTSSRFVPVKRIDRLINAFAKIKDIENSVLLLVGDGVLLDELKQQVKELNISKYVIFTGYVSNIRDFQQLMDICVFSSQSEAFGLVAIETLSLGKPSLVFEDGGGLVEIIEGINKDDVVADESSLVARIEYYRSHTEEIELLKKARIQYAKKFDINSVAQEFISIYQNKQ